MTWKGTVYDLEESSQQDVLAIAAKDNVVAWPSKTVELCNCEAKKWINRTRRGGRRQQPKNLLFTLAVRQALS